MNNVRRYLVRALLPVMHAVVVVLIFKVRKYPRVRIGTCSFYGPASFLTLCEEAMAELERRDSSVSASLKQGNYVFWYDSTKLEYFEKHFSINDAYCVWKHLGIAAFLVYASFKTGAFTGRVFPLSDHTEARTLNTDVREKTRQWLAKHSFPIELVDCFCE